MQEIPGRPVHDLPESKIVELSKEIGKIAGTLHKNGSYAWRFDNF